MPIPPQKAMISIMYFRQTGSVSGLPAGAGILTAIMISAGSAAGFPAGVKC